MTTSLKIAVLVSPACHPLSGRPLRSTSDAAALELGWKLAPPDRVTVLCAGMVSRDRLHDYLGLGAPSIEVLTVPDDDGIVPALVARLRGFDVVLCGARSEGQSASGLLPYLLAEGLQAPLVTDVLDAAYAGQSLMLKQFLPKGMRRQLAASLPVVLAVHARAPQTRQFAYARASTGRISYMAAAHPGKQMAAPDWQLEDANRRPRPLKAKVTQSGHSRMMSAVAADSGSPGGQVIKQGSPEQKAQVLLDYLREHRLVDF